MEMFIEKENRGEDTESAIEAAGIARIKLETREWSGTQQLIN